MTKYIDADKLKRFVRELKERAKRNSCDTWGIVPDALEEVENFIDSLQQEQPIQVNTLTWKDINDLERIINNVHYEFRNGIGEKSFGEEVLERFKEERDEQDQPDKVDFEDVWKTYYDNHLFLRSPMPSKRDIARHFYELGQREMRRRITNPEYNAKVVERLKSEYPVIKEE